mmetsp:Transcript_56136/g.128465  ORF Transcript_56136/g.128465 Transcript_56136/m.128465 type:complete len:266 (+) Transcript_56136:91-888(+)|eukprot:CAMPEP_0180272118 /NCGR_PEP_ID=MMETSP0988-20121125/4076_1 /TAXON_ID=697907 /ORGANISM="non described non described, Strain CCMP2293" /LENGTH=265 /DNA_ID=CAMNT_0022243171 /DNA_START=76 /DNA_END=873 /DNA_ORIENTATION=+
MELGGGDVYPSKIINIPNEAVGRIIGKGGTMIKQLAAQSGARIKMQKQQTLGSPTRPLTLEGSPLAISAAQGLIMEQINEAQQRANGSWNADATPLSSGSSLSAAAAYGGLMTPPGRNPGGNTPSSALAPHVRGGGSGSKVSVLRSTGPAYSLSPKQSMEFGGSAKRMGEEEEHRRHRARQGAIAAAKAEASGAVQAAGGKAASEPARRPGVVLKRKAGAPPTGAPDGKPEGKEGKEDLAPKSKEAAATMAGLMGEYSDSGSSSD